MAAPHLPIQKRAEPYWQPVPRIPSFLSLAWHCRNSVSWKFIICMCFKAISVKTSDFLSTHMTCTEQHVPRIINYVHLYILLHLNCHKVTYTVHTQGYVKQRSHKQSVSYVCERKQQVKKLHV